MQLPAPCCLLLVSALVVLAPGAPPAAAATAIPRPKTKPSAAQAMPATPPTHSVEALAELARPSVVVISHYGRNGTVDGMGAGVIISPDGLIATSLHVIGEARPISVQLADGKRYEVTEIHAWDRKLDLAVIRIGAKNLKALPLGNSASLKQGTAVVAMGNPLGLEHSIVQGVVSARREVDGVQMIQLAIPIESGNSGGPLLDLQGRVHGLLTLKSVLTANLGFATPIDLLKPLLAKPNAVPMARWLTINTLNPKEWSPQLGGRWIQAGGGIRVEGVGQGFGGRSLCLWQKPVPTRPFEVSVSVRLEDESGAAGLVFAATDNDHHYGFYPSAGQLRLTRFNGPTVNSWTILNQVQSPHYLPGEWNLLRVRVEKEKILCYVNDHLVLESSDQELRGTRLGLAKFRDTHASFRGFQVGTNLAAPTASPALLRDLAQAVESITNSTQLLHRLQPHASLAQPLLLERARHLEAQADRLRSLAREIHRQAVQSDLLKLLQGREETIDLFHASLLVARLDFPELDVEAYRRQLSGMAGEILAKLSPKADARARLAALTRYLFEENGFHGSRTDYYNRANSYLNQVMDDREGLPLTLSILFLELGRCLQINGLSGVALPGHFLVKFTPATGPEEFIDVFEEGKRLTRQEINRRIEDYTGAPSDLASLPTSAKREIIVRMLRNLTTVAGRDARGALPYLDLLLALQPDSAPDRILRARARYQNGEVPGAREDFKWILDHAPDGVDLDKVNEVYKAIK